jgi:hypothetical protein
MKKYLAPILGAVVVWVGFATMPDLSALAASATLATPAAVELPPTVLAIPFLGDALMKVAHWLPALFQLVGFFAMVASLTKNETDDKVIGWILKVINVVGFNVGAAKNDPGIK